MFLRARPSDAPAPPVTPRWTGGVITASVVLLLALGLYPTPLVRWARSSSLQPGPQAVRQPSPAAIEAQRLTAR